MKRMNLIAPEVCKGFFGERRREMVTYLKIEKGFGKRQFEEDLKNGAAFFGSLDTIARKPAVHTIVVRADNKEVGLMAVSYIAGICNEQDKVKEEDSYAELSDALTAFDDAPESEYSEYSEYDDTYDEEESDYETWEENPYRVPILTISDIHSYDNTGCFSEFGSSSFRMQGSGSSRRKDPYWMDCTKEPVCILCGNNDYGNYSETVGIRFKKNRHVFLLELPDRFGFGAFPFGGFDDCGDFSKMENPNFSRMVLEEAATVIDILSDASISLDTFRAYRLIQFENWVEKENLKLEKEFPKNKIVSRILKMNQEDKSELFHQILHYIVVQGDAGEYLKESDFEILNRFIRRGMERNTAVSASKKMEKQLYGMDEVKQRVHEIVDVLLYHKRREELGLKNGGFHNVHLLIGAPGTAKTTIARYMGELMAERHLLPGDRFTCVNGADLKGMYVGHTAPKVHNLFEENDIIMIDEAYSLTSQDSSDCGDSFGQEAVSTLITEIEEHGTEKLVLFAGYGGVDVEEKDNLMKRFIDTNPGLKSRINSTIYFESYSAAQMVEIVHILAKAQNFTLSRKADKDICAYFETRRKDRNFGNGREARSLLENAMIFAAGRTKRLHGWEMNKRKMREISVSDIRNAIERLKFGIRMQNGRNNRKSIGFAE